MQEKIQKLQKEFKRIKDMGFVRERRKGFCSVGYIFESLLEKEEDNFPVADYSGIEIKTMNTHSTMNLHLFNLTPDGETFFPIKKIISELGYPCREDKSKKIFYHTFSGKVFSKIIYGRKGKLEVDRKNERINLLIFDNKNNDTNINIYWSFASIKERLDLKLKYLALVLASSRIIDGYGHYYYHTIHFYRLKEFDVFLDLIEKGEIEITFKIGFYKSGRREGQIYDHGTDFSISPSNLSLLYDEIE